MFLAGLLLLHFQIEHGRMCLSNIYFLGAKQYLLKSKNQDVSSIPISTFYGTWVQITAQKGLLDEKYVPW